jgi:hypothetical protein
MNRSAEQTVTTWADGFGLWHARVTYDRNPMAAAQVAIWKEIAARQGSEAPVPAVTQDETDPAVWHESEVMQTGTA